MAQGYLLFAGEKIEGFVDELVQVLYLLAVHACRA
jgi:hypothetical protein